MSNLLKSVLPVFRCSTCRMPTRCSWESACIASTKPCRSAPGPSSRPGSAASTAISHDFSPYDRFNDYPRLLFSPSAPLVCRPSDRDAIPVPLVQSHERSPSQTPTPTPPPHQASLISGRRRPAVCGLVEGCRSASSCVVGRSPARAAPSRTARLQPLDGLCHQVLRPMAELPHPRPELLLQQLLVQALCL